MSKRFIDFIVKFDPENEDKEDLIKKILYSVFIRNRLKANKPVIMFIGGDSGEGKSKTAIRLQQLLYEIQGHSLSDYIEQSNIFSPLEYSKKIDALLYKKELKPVNLIAMHEARDLIRSSKWNDFLSQTISDINTQSRAIKRLMIIIISQFIRDITTDVRYSLTHYCKVSRTTGRKAKLEIYIMWKDDSDIEKPRIRRRRLYGRIIYPNGKHKNVSPKFFWVNLPPKELVDKFDELDKQAKSDVIRNKLEKMTKQIEKDLGIEDNKIEKIAQWYTKDEDRLMEVGKVSRKKYRIGKQIREIHDLTPTETKTLERKINDKLKNKGFFSVKNN